MSPQRKPSAGLMSRAQDGPGPCGFRKPTDSFHSQSDLGMAFLGFPHHLPCYHLAPLHSRTAAAGGRRGLACPTTAQGTIHSVSTIPASAKNRDG